MNPPSMASSRSASSSLGEEIGQLVSVLWNHRFLTGAVLFICIPPILPVIAYSFPLLVSTSLCVVVFSNFGGKVEEYRQEMEAWIEGRRPEVCNPPSGKYQISESPWVPCPVESSNYRETTELSGAGGVDAPALVFHPSSAPSGATGRPGGGQVSGSGMPRVFRRPPAMERRLGGSDASHLRWANWLEGFEAHSSQFTMEEAHQDDGAPAYYQQDYHTALARKGSDWSGPFGQNNIHRKCRSVDGSVTVEPFEVVGRHDSPNPCGGFNHLRK